MIIAPHPDDEVIGCGGLIHRVKREGGEVFVLYLTVDSAQDFSRRGFSTREERVREAAAVARFLKLDGYRIAFPGDEHHLRLDTIPQKDIVHEIERGRKISLEDIQPSILITYSPNDYNQDHRAATSATITAARPVPNTFKSFQRLVLLAEHPTSIWSAESAAATPNFFVELNRKDLAAKLQALRLYHSQLKHHRGPFSPRAIRTLAELRGMQTGVEIAEAFFLKRLRI